MSGAELNIKAVGGKLAEMFRLLISLKKKRVAVGSRKSNVII